MRGENDIIQRMFFDLQWGNGGDPTPGGTIVAQTGDPLFILICMIILITIIAGSSCYVFRDKIFGMRKAATNFASAVSAISLSSKIAMAIASVAAIVLCSLVFVASNAYATEEANGEWNQYRSHIKSNAYLDPSTGDLTFDIPTQSQPYAGKGLVYGFGANQRTDSNSLLHCWWELYIDDQCLYSFYGHPTQVNELNAIVGNSFNIKLIARNVNIAELSPYIGTDFFEFFYAMVDAKFYPTIGHDTYNCQVPVNIDGLEIVDQERFDNFCTENGWVPVETSNPTIYYKMYSSDILTSSSSVVKDVWANLISEGILIPANSNEQFSHFCFINNLTSSSPTYSMIQGISDYSDNIWSLYYLVPVFSNNDMYPVTIQANDLIPWTQDGKKAALADGWVEDADGFMTKSFPGEALMPDVLKTLPDSWFNLDYCIGPRWCICNCSVYDLNKYIGGVEFYTIDYWRYEKIDGTVVDENGQPIKDVRVYNDIKTLHPEISSATGMYCADTDISDSNGYFELYFPKGSEPIVYCDDEKLDGLVPDVTSDRVFIQDYKTQHLGQFTVYKCGYFNVTELNVPAGADEIYFEYLTKDKDGKDHIFYSQQFFSSADMSIRVPINTKGYIITENPIYTFEEADQEVIAPGWGETISVNRTVILRELSKKKEEPIFEDPLLLDAIVPETNTSLEIKK